MKSDKCNHQVNFLTSLLVTNPYNYPCPHCQKRLTLDKTGRRSLIAIVAIAGLYASGIGAFSILSALQGVPLEQLAVVNLISLLAGTFFLLPMLYLAWKRSRFIERTKLVSIQHSTKQKAGPEKTPFRYRLILSPSNS